MKWIYIYDADDNKHCIAPVNGWFGSMKDKELEMCLWCLINYSAHLFRQWRQVHQMKCKQSRVAQHKTFYLSQWTKWEPNSESNSYCATCCYGKWSERAECRKKAALKQTKPLSKIAYMDGMLGKNRRGHFNRAMFAFLNCRRTVNKDKQWSCHSHGLTFLMNFSFCSVKTLRQYALCANKKWSSPNDIFIFPTDSLGIGIDHFNLFIVAVQNGFKSI